MSPNSSNSRASNIGPYFFYIEGLPNDFTWQDLKDLIRTEASHGIWTDMAVFQGGRTSGKGYARVQRSDEAKALYAYLTQELIEGQGLRVHMWDISQSNAEPRFMQCNCDPNSPIQHTSHGYPAQGLEVRRMAIASGWQNIIPEIPQATMLPSQTATLSYRPLPMAAQMYQAGCPPDAALVQAMGGMQLSSQDPRNVPWYQAQSHPYATATPQLQRTMQPIQQHPYWYQQVVMPMPYYTYTPAGTPINTTHGTVRMESRGIFVSGLNYKARAKDIETLFSQAGVITRCELHKDTTTGKSKGIATIQYATSDEVQRAIQLFHGNSFMSMRLQVRRDKEATAIRAPPSQTKKSQEPIIVNGSQTR